MFASHGYPKPGYPLPERGLSEVLIARKALFREGDPKLFGLVMVKLWSGKEMTLLPSPPLRTMHEGFPSHGSSLDHFIPLSLMMCMMTPPMDEHTVIGAIAFPLVPGEDVMVVDGVPWPEGGPAQPTGIVLCSRASFCF